MNSYKILNKQVFSEKGYFLVPIRFEDRMDIMKWRNEQIYHLRQSQPLTAEDQENYFKNVVYKLFFQEEPNQILFSYLHGNQCIGYGGLVHINWIDKNAEISFIMDTDLENNEFETHWFCYLSLIEKVAFDELNLHKIYTYAFDLRPHLYAVLEKCNFKQEARLKEHCYINGHFLDVVYHSKINRNIKFRKANGNDLMLYFKWANDTNVRLNSYQSQPILLETHTKWFLNKINDSNCEMMVFENHLGNPIGQVRIQKQENKIAIIGISNDENFRGQGYASRMIKIAYDFFLELNPQFCIEAYIKLENEASIRAFEKAGFEFNSILLFENVMSNLYIKKL